MIEDDKRNLANILEEKSKWSCKNIQHAIGYPKLDDECSSWVECQRHWDFHTKFVEWTTAKWPKKRKINYRELQQTQWSH